VVILLVYYPFVKLIADYICQKDNICLMNEQGLRNILSSNVKRYRRYRKLSQEKMAEKLDISIPFLSDIENGKKWVSPRTLAKMADVLKIEAYELLRPAEILPDSAINVIEKYSADISKKFSLSLEELMQQYIRRLNGR
jgi:transcriptional regulator with XRE-family HTH domain